MTWRDDPWFLGATILTAGKGGIARVARLTARAIIESNAPIEILSLADPEPVMLDGVVAATARNSRAIYTARCHIGALSSRRFLYDAVGPARAHPRFWPRRPFGLWIHGIEVWNALSRDRRRALLGAEFVLVNSNFTLSRYTDLHGRLASAHVCELATETDEPVLRLPRDPESRPTVLLVGRSDAESFRKGHTEVIAAWPSVCAAVPGARLLMAGSGSGIGILRDLVSHSPVRQQIEVLGFVPETRMEQLWQSCDVFALPSWQEGFGLVYVEAMRQGLPVIASIHDAGQEVNIDGVTGYNVDLNAPETLVSAIVALLSDRERARTMGAAGQARWHQCYRYSNFRDRLWATLDRAEKA